MRVLVGAAARGRPEQYRIEIAAALPPELADVSFDFDLHDGDDEWDACIEDCSVIILTSRGLGRRAIARARKLRFVQKLGIVADRVDLKACRDRGIQVSVMSDPGHVAVAEHTILLALAMSRCLIPSHAAMMREDNPRALTPIKTTQTARRPNWLGLPENDFPMLADLTLGLIGFGEIAREVALRATRLFKNVLYTKRKPLDRSVELDYRVSFAPLEDLLAQADIVSVHATQADYQPPLIAARELSLMRAGAAIINTARGNQIDEAALVAALEAGHLKSAALDVFATEPLLNSRLLKLPNVICTPHTAGMTPTERAFGDAIANLRAFREGRQPVGLVRQV